jgi:hypothetical protein
MGCYNSTVVNAPIDDVWKMICNFHDLSWGEPLITKLEVIGDIPGDQIGAKRLLNDLFHETLITLNPENYTFSYVITDGPEPISKETVTNYIGKVRLLPVTDCNKTFVEWTSAYESEQPDAVAEFCNPIYVALLDSLKTRFAS